MFGIFIVGCVMACYVPWSKCLGAFKDVSSNFYYPAGKHEQDTGVDYIHNPYAVSRRRMFHFPDEPHREMWPYGLVVWRNVLIPQQREALLSAFEEYVVMRSISHRWCNCLRVYQWGLNRFVLLCMLVALCLQIHSCMRLCGTHWKKVGQRFTAWFGSQPGVGRKEDAFNNHVPRLRSTNNKVVDENKQRAQDAAPRRGTDYAVCVPSLWCGGWHHPHTPRLPGANS